jgi:hypothetical protein
LGVSDSVGVGRVAPRGVCEQRCSQRAAMGRVRQRGRGALCVRLPPAGGGMCITHVCDDMVTNVIGSWFEAVDLHVCYQRGRC